MSRQFVAFAFLIFVLPALASAACQTAPITCRAGTSLVYQASSASCPRGNYTCTTTATSRTAAVSSSQTLKVGSRGDSVVLMQRLLIQKGFLAAGNDSGYFGALTKAAVQKFQRDNGIASSGTEATTGYGAIGPKTRAKLIETSGITLITPGKPSIPSIPATPFTPLIPNLPISGSAGGGGGGGAPVVSQPKTCTVDGITLAEGSSGKFYAQSFVQTPATCSSQTRTCTNGSLNGPSQYVYASCLETTQALPRASCSFSNQSIPSGASVTAYKAATSPYGTPCEKETRVCTNGILSGTYQSAACTESQPAACTFNGQTIPHGTAVTAYQSAFVPSGQTCATEQRTCTNGTLSGTFTYGTCTIGAAQSCVWNNQSIANGNTVTAYQASSVAYGGQCVSEQRTCTNGSFSGSYQSATCSVAQPLNCSFNGQSVVHGQSVNAYQSSSVSFGQTCTSQQRTCSSGTLSGTYTFNACAVATAQNCTFNNQSIPHGSTVTAFQSATVPYGGSCTSQARLCTNGTLSGSYTNASCTVTPGASCTFDGQQIAHGSSVTAYQTATVPYGGQCTAEQRVCTNGTLSGSYINTGCSVSGGASCTFNGQNVAHGQSVTAYQSSSVAYGGQCSSEQRVCTNGSLSGGFTNASCSVQAGSLINAKDWVVQDVCVDGSGNSIPGDPAVCSNHRDVAFGETIPYVRADDQNVNAAMTFPVQMADGGSMFALTKDFTANPVLRPLAAFNNWEITTTPSNDAVWFPNGMRTWDGLDLIEINGPTVSLPGTQDARHFFHPWYNTNCQMDDSWVAFPTGMREGESGTLQSTMRWDDVAALSNPYQCHTSTFSVSSHWAYLNSFTYGSGKSLPTIQTFVNTGGGQSTSFEVFYFTKEYGYTRWDSWGATPHPEVTWCSGPQSKVMNGVTAYIADCRDWTKYKLPDHPIQPLASPLGDKAIFSKNLLRFGDFAERTMTGWAIQDGPSGKVTDYNFGSASDGGSGTNYYLLAACYSGCDGNSVYQDVAFVGPHDNLAQATSFRYGGVVSASGPAQAYLVVHYIASNGSVISSAKTPLAIVGSGWQRIDAVAPAPSSAPERIRLEFYMYTQGVEYRIDEMYLTPTR